MVVSPKYKTDESIILWSGKRFWPLRPDPEAITIEDLAHALARTNRFSGHLPAAYSVAQHSVIVSMNCKSCDALEGLLHDAPEVLGLTDMPSPVKKSMPPMVRDWFESVERGLWRALAARFKLAAEIPESVHRADIEVLKVELSSLRGIESGVGCWIPGCDNKIGAFDAVRAERCFLDRFEQLRR